MPVESRGNNLEVPVNFEVQRGYTSNYIAPYNLSIDPLLPLFIMGCGGSKEEPTKPYHGHSTGPRPSKKSGEESDTLSELSTRPVAPSRAGHAQPPTRPAPVQVSKPKQPDGRVNSANPKTSFVRFRLQIMPHTPSLTLTRHLLPTCSNMFHQEGISR